MRQPAAKAVQATLAVVRAKQAVSRKTRWLYIVLHTIVFVAASTVLICTVYDDAEGAEMRGLVERARQSFKQVTSLLLQPHVAMFVIAAYALWIVAAATKQFVLSQPWKSVLGKSPKSEVERVAHGVSLFVYSIGLIFVLSNFGLDTTVLTSSMGITAVAAGFALREFAMNVICGLFLLAYDQYLPGDRIRVKDYEGIVSKVNLRYTVVQGVDVKDGQLFFIPNREMTESIVTLISRAPEVEPTASPVPGESRSE